MKWLVALGLAFTFEIITSKCIKLFIVHFFGKNIDNDNYILIRKMVHDIFFSGIVVGLVTVLIAIVLDTVM